MKRLLAISVLLVACGGSATPSNAVPVTAPATYAASPVGTPDPCVQATTYLGAFTSQLAPQIVGLRPLIVAKQFDASATGAAILRINATFTAFDGIGQVVGDCPPTAALAPSVDKLITSASATLDGATAGSINDGQLQRDSAASLFELLPEVLAIAAANQTVADGLGLAAQIADVQVASTKPLGSLPPLVGPTPKPTPRPTPRPTSGGGGSGGSGTGSSSDWTVRANDYLSNASGTYHVVTSDALNLFGYDDSGPGLTPAEVKALEEEAALYWKPAVRALNGHLAWIASHPPRSCYADAYSADKSLAKRWLTILHSGAYPGDATPEGRQQTIVYNDALSRTSTFLRRVNSYFGDCP